MRPLPLAREWSTTSAPVRCSSTKSLMPTQKATPSWIFGSTSRNHMSFTSGDIGWIGVPVRRCSSRAPVVCRSCSAWLRARVSPQVMTEVTGANSASRPSRLCMAEENEMPATRSAPSSATTSRTALTAAARIACGSCTAWPGCGVSSG